MLYALHIYLNKTEIFASFLRFMLCFHYTGSFFTPFWNEPCLMETAFRSVPAWNNFCFIIYFWNRTERDVSLSEAERSNDYFIKESC